MSIGGRAAPGFLIVICVFVLGCESEQAVWPEIVQPARQRQAQVLLPRPTEQPARQVPAFSGTIVVDAGHGGDDPGAGEVGYSRLAEKIIVLDIAKEVAACLERAGARVIMTRTSDFFVELDARAVMAERYGADLLVSIHVDSSPDEQISGATIYAARNGSYQSRRAARSIQSSFMRAGINTRGIREADFKVLVNHSRPSVLVECGYLTNRADAQRLNTDWYRSKVGQALCEGIIQGLAARDR